MFEVVIVRTECTTEAPRNFFPLPSVLRILVLAACEKLWEAVNCVFVCDSAVFVDCQESKAIGNNYTRKQNEINFGQPITSSSVYRQTASLIFVVEGNLG